MAATRALKWTAFGSSSSSAANEEQPDAEQRDQDRHQRDVHDLGPEHQALGVLAQVLAHFFQGEPRLGNGLAEALELRLLLGAHDLASAFSGAGRSALCLLQRLQLRRRLLQLVLERLDFSEVLLLRLGLELA